MWTTMPSPIGDLRLVEAGGALTAIHFAPFGPMAVTPMAATQENMPQENMPDVLTEAIAQLRTYFDGELREFDVPMAPEGTEFQRRVWRELRTIPYGTTASYGEIATRMDLSTGAARAVGLANAHNPIPIIVPCHRVIGADGSLTGYAGGLARKRYLLGLEAGEQPLALGI